MKTSSIVVMCQAVTLAGAQPHPARAADSAATNTAGEMKINHLILPRVGPQSELVSATIAG